MSKGFFFSPFLLWISVTEKVPEDSSWAEVAQQLCVCYCTVCALFSPSLQRSPALIFLHHCTRFIAPVNFCKRRKRRYLRTLGIASMRSPDCSALAVQQKHSWGFNCFASTNPELKMSRGDAKVHVCLEEEGAKSSWKQKGEVGERCLLVPEECSKGRRREKEESSMALQFCLLKTSQERPVFFLERKFCYITHCIFFSFCFILHQRERFPLSLNVVYLPFDLAQLCDINTHHGWWDDFNSFATPSDLKNGTWCPKGSPSYIVDPVKKKSEKSLPHWLILCRKTRRKDHIHCLRQRQFHTVLRTSPSTIKCLI